MNYQEYYQSDSIEEESRRASAFNILSAVREAFHIASESPLPPSYRKALTFIHDFDPFLYENITYLLRKGNENELAKYYLDKAERLSEKEGILFNAIDLINNDLEEENGLMTINHSRSIKKKISELKAAKESLSQFELSEDKIIKRDFSLSDRHFIFFNDLYENDVYKDYQLPNDKILRLRILHPDIPEHILGADLVYEEFDLKREKVRFMHLQYKMFNDKNYLYINDERLIGQINKMSKHVCDANYCLDEFGNSHSGFRLPYCAAFFRPTDKIQTKDSRLASSGHHIPICEMKNILKNGKKSITRNELITSSLNNQVFENLFTKNFVGSRWISIDKLEEFYESKNINSLTENIRVHISSVQYL